MAAVQVLGAANHITFVGGDGSIYGMGDRIQRYYSMETDTELMRKIEFPDGTKGSDIKKVSIGKFNRLVLTHDGKLYHNGQSKFYQLGPSISSGNEDQFIKFKKIEDDWFRNGDDKIVDAIAGRHYNMVFTMSGKMIFQGYRFYR